MGGAVRQPTRNHRTTTLQRPGGEPRLLAVNFQSSNGGSSPGVKASVRRPHRPVRHPITPDTSHDALHKFISLNQNVKPDPSVLGAARLAN